MITHKAVSTMLGGYAGQNLEINLSTNQVDKKPLDVHMARSFIGGTGFGTKILYDEVGPEIDPLSPYNVLIISAGPLVGTLSPLSSRVELTSKSPLTGLIGCSNVGGFWGAFLKKAGYDNVILRGASKRPVYIWVDDKQVEIRGAEDIWGRCDTWDTVDRIRRVSNQSDVSIMSIGPAGENLVRYACIVVDLYHAAGRTGCGAVLGSKKVKAIAVRGTGTIKVARPREFSDTVRDATERVMSSPSFKEFSVSASLSASRRDAESGALPRMNWQSSEVKDWVKNMTLDVASQYLSSKGEENKREIGCHACPVQCFHQVDVKSGKFSGLKISSGTFVMPIFEFGAKCEVNSLPAVWKCKELCFRLGLDQASSACAIAFAMELFQRKIVCEKDTDGMKLMWGYEDTIFTMLHRIAYREGFGDLLAEGVKRATGRLGGEAEKCAITVKGMELMGTDPRVGGRAWHLGTLINPRGGDNMRTTHTSIERSGYRRSVSDEDFVEWLDMPRDLKDKTFGRPPRICEEAFEGKALLVKWYSDLFTVMNALGVCVFALSALGALGPTYLAKMYSACTGWDISPSELTRIGEKIFNLQRMYDVRQGVSPKDDDWPERFYQPMPDGPAKDTTLSRHKVRQVLDEVYELYGWDKASGLPNRKKLSELGLSE